MQIWYSESAGIATGHFTLARLLSIARIAEKNGTVQQARKAQMSAISARKAPNQGRRGKENDR